MLVKVTKDSKVLLDGKLYQAGDQLELEGDRLDTALAAGHVAVKETTHENSKKR